MAEIIKPTLQQIVNLFKTYMTAQQLIDSTSIERKKLAEYVRLTNIIHAYPDKTNRKRLRRVTATAQCLINHDGTRRINPPYYQVEVVGVDNFYRIYESPVKVSCSCPDIKFRFAYVLERKKAIVKKLSNGKPPLIRNPTYTPMTCKHSVALLNYIIKNKL